ncbi:MAG: hypothetical protein Q4Q24_07340 [Methanobrevibacter ruminantium]|uniref:hypothetical protein n=1 Tax=Methanobrevibacter ruminantium TaxID=83816 RepID=UPI0026F326EC|nr:hypothetical protein [Methanobrevibacter ruminantium]MDO5843063.1 hypothetical protein [Methanobrevibacter ruminantium]
MMVVNRVFAKFCGVCFFVELLMLLSTVLGLLGFHGAGNPILRLIVLGLCFLGASVFYGFISVDKEVSDEKGCDKGWFLVKGDLEYWKLLLIIIVSGFFIIFLLLVILAVMGVSVFT